MYWIATKFLFITKLGDNIEFQFTTNIVLTHWSIIAPINSS